MNNNKKEQNDDKKILTIAIGIMLILIAFAGATYAYFAFSASDNILVTSFNDLSSNLNNKCLYTDGELATCQLYKIVLTNNADGVNTKVVGSVSFNNATSPNLSWIKLDNYDASTTYTASSIGGDKHKASSTFTNFSNAYLLKKSNSVTYYLLVWVDESEDEQTDDGSFTGTVRFEDENGKGVTSTFGA